MKFNLIVSELHNELIHGQSDIPYGHYLVHHICRHSSPESDDEDWSDYEHDGEGEDVPLKKFEYTIYVDAKVMVHLLKLEYRDIKPKNHLFIRNYRNIINKSSYFQPQIAECIYIGDVYVAIIKTFWLKIVQRTWKKIYAKRLRMIKNPTNLFYRQMHGPTRFPTLRGMLAS
jgi:hypothetical protein